MLAYLFSEVLFDYFIDHYKRAAKMTYFEIMFSNTLAAVIWGSCILFFLLHMHFKQTFKLPDEWRNNIKTKCPHLSE